MKSKTKTASQLAKKIKPTLAQLKAQRKRFASISDGIPEPVIKEWLAKRGVDWASMMTEGRRREIIHELIRTEYQDNEFCVDLDCVAEQFGKQKTLPCEITLDVDSWLMVARVARHQKCSYGDVVSACIVRDAGMLCTMDGEASGAAKGKAGAK